MALFAELRRRNVLKVALLYAVASWLILWFIEATAEVLGLPPWGEVLVVILLAAGFPVALLFAWTYEITPAGLKRSIDVDQTQSIVYKTGQKLNAAVAVLLVLGLLALIGQGLLPKFEFFVPSVPEGDAPGSSKTPAEIRSLVLRNGLKIIVWPDPDVTDVLMYNFVRAGSRNEYPGITGVSRLIEHLMSTGAGSMAPGEFPAALAAADATANAYTSRDLTVFQTWFPKASLETIFDLERQRLNKLTLVPEVIERERATLLSERRSNVDQNDFNRLFEQVVATAFLAHPYQIPVGGWRADIASMTTSEIEDYFRSHYAPNNCTMIITGAVTPVEIFALAERYLATIPAQDPPATVRTIEPAQSGTRRLRLDTNADTQRLHIAFHAGRAADARTLAMTLLIDILAGDASSRLHQALVDGKDGAVSVGAQQHLGFDPGFVYLHVELPADADISAAESAVVATLRNVIEEGVSDEELANAKKHLESDYWSLATIDGKVEALGFYEVFHGNYERLFAHSNSVNTITRKDLQAVAASVFRADNMTVGVMRRGASTD